ncbi:MAG: VOC family protein [Anaerolineales bacterium]|nr:VOC family protein [Anaerolineales bacterium]MCB0015911.1 VOC family protein [Anaerolineales bacterium]
MAIQLKRLDHLVLTVADIAATVAFYEAALGMVAEQFAGGRIALRFGEQKINLHEHGHEFEPKAQSVQPGSADLCFVTSTPVAAAKEALEALGIEILEGPVRKSGALGPIQSVYFRDPDGNLLELANYLES